MSIISKRCFKPILVLVLITFTFQQTSFAAPIYKNLATGTSGDATKTASDESTITDLEICNFLEANGRTLSDVMTDPNIIDNYAALDILVRVAREEISTGEAIKELTGLKAYPDEAEDWVTIASNFSEGRVLEPFTGTTLGGIPESVYYGVYNSGDTGVTLLDEGGSPILKDDGKPAVIPSGRTIDIGVMYSSEWSPHLSDVRQVFAEALGVGLDGEGRPVGDEETQQNFRVTFGQFALLHETGHQVWDRMLAKHLGADDKKVDKQNREAFSNLFAKAALGFDIDDTLPPDEARIRENVKLVAPTLRGSERILLEGLLGDKPILRYDGTGKSDLVAVLERVGIDTIPHMRDLTFKNESKCQELVAALARAIDAGQLEAMAASAAGEEELAGHLAHFGLGAMTTAELVSSLKTPAGEMADEALLRDIGWTPEYVAGIFTREDCATLLGGYDYPEEEAYPVMNKLIAEMSRQLLIIQGNPEPTAQQIDTFARDTLHAESIRDIYRLVYHAQGPQGNLHLSGYGEMELYRMAYRDILELLLGNLAIPGVEPKQLSAVLSNPLRDSNNEGNDEVRDAVSEMMTAGVLTDDVDALRANPQRIKDWFRYTVASNDIDYTRPSFLEEREKADFNLVAYIKEIVAMNFVGELGAEAYIDEFIARYCLSGEKRSLVVEADNNVELIFLLKTCEILLSLNPNLRISFVAKPDNRVINDASVADVERTLSLDGEKAEDDRIFENLRSYFGNRFVLVEGPRSQGTPLDMLPASVAQAIRDADAVFAMGEAHFWCLSGLQKPVYFGLKLKWKPMVQMLLGVDVEKTGDKPPAFFRVDGGLYFKNVASGQPRSVAPDESPIQVAELCVRDVLTPLDSDAHLTRLAQQLQQAVQAEGIEDWAQVAQRAQQVAGDAHPNLAAALQPLIASPQNYTGLTPDELQAQAETLIEEHGITDEDEIATLRLCLGLDWGQGLGGIIANIQADRLIKKPISSKMSPAELRSLSERIQKVMEKLPDKVTRLRRVKRTVYFWSRFQHKRYWDGMDLGEEVYEEISESEYRRLDKKVASNISTRQVSEFRFVSETNPRIEKLGNKLADIAKALKILKVTSLAHRLRVTVTSKGLEDWRAMAECARELAGKDHPNLTAALQSLIRNPRGISQLDVQRLEWLVNFLVKRYKITNQDEVNVLRLCLGLDWGQGGGETHIARAQPHQPSRMQSEANWQDLAWNKDNVKAVHDKSIAIQKQAVSVTHRKSVFVVIPYDLIQFEERTPLTQFQIQVRRWMEKNSNCHVITKYTSEELNKMLSEGVVEIDGEELTRDNCFAFLDSEVAEANADALARRVRILPLMKPAFGQLIQWEGLANLGLGFLTVKSPKDDPQIRNVRELWNLMIGADFDTQVGPMLGLMFDDPARFIRELIKISLIALPQEQRFDLQQLRDFYGGAAEYLEGQA